MKTTQRNFQGPRPHYGAAKEGSTPVNHAQTNFDGGRTTKKGGGSRNKPQMNFEGGMSIPVKFEKGQGQKAGTGCNDGY